MKQILLATGNEHKKEEFQQMMPDIQILTLKDLEVPVEIIEDGMTFEENALIKARAAHKASGLPAMADDSGLEVDSLDGFPGIHSARWMGEQTSYEEKNAALINLVKDKDRTARYVCAIAYIDENGKEYVCRGTIEGEIAPRPAGNHGFGYDPIFYYPPFGKTLAEVPETKKHSVSHRGKALHTFLKDWSGKL